MQIELEENWHKSCLVGAILLFLTTGIITSSIYVTIKALNNLLQ